MKTFLSRLILRLRWHAARPVVQPILDDMAEYEKNLRRGATELIDLSFAERYMRVEKADTLSAYQTEIEEAFGRISFDEGHRVVRHY